MADQLGLGGQSMPERPTYGRDEQHAQEPLFGFPQTMTGQLPLDTDEPPSRLTYRERRERKATRLREWADKREARAESAHRQARGIGDLIPTGQPILMGHHSQRRHERDLARMDRAMSATLEHSRKADEMRRRADNIEAAADQAIYSDDPNAVDRLRDKLAALEARREDMKARNAAFRKSHRDELRGMTPYQRDRTMPHPSYELQNLGGNISRTRKRLVALQVGRA